MTYQYLSQEDMTKENLVNDASFIEDASFILEDRAGYDFDFSKENINSEIYDAYMEHFRRQNVNEVTATKDLFYVQTADSDTQERFGRLMDTYDSMDSDFGWKAAGDYMEGVFTAPSTYLGMFSFGAGKAGALAAQQGVKLGIREIVKNAAKKKLLKEGKELTAENIKKATAKASVGQRIQAAGQGFKTGGWKTAGASALIDAGVSGMTVYQQERTREELGIKDGISWKDVGLAATFSALGSGTIGAITGTRRALTSNTAEQIRQTAILKEGAEIDNVWKNITSKTFKNEKTSKIAKEVRKKLSLAETVPEKLAEGKIIKTADEAGRVPTTEEKFLDNIASAAAEIVSRVEPLPNVKLEQERITSILARGITQGGLSEDLIAGILNKHGLSLNQLTSLMVEDMSSWGKMGQKMGAITKKLKQEALDELTELDQKLINLGDITSPARKALEEATPESKGIWAKTAQVLTPWLSLPALNKARIGFMTIQTATTARNTTNGYMRNYVYALDNLGSGLAKTTKGLAYKLTRLSNGDLVNEANRSVALGMAEMKTGLQALTMKDMWLGMKSWETEALELLFRDPKFAKSDLAKSLFREMGDVGEEISAEGGIVSIARKANFLNTMSDNMFKRAIFSREIDKALKATDMNKLMKGGLSLEDAKNFIPTDASDIIKASDQKIIDKMMGSGLNTVEASWYSKGLKEFFEDGYFDPEAMTTQIGKFSQIDDKIVGEAMEVALESTYQTGKFAGKAGGFNKFADYVITQASKNVLASAFIPFPRYLINQFVFQYEHMPIIGLVNFGGILNKRGSRVLNKKTNKFERISGERGINIGTDALGFRLALDSEAFGKQLGGLGTLASFYAIRNHYGDETTGPYEFKVGGETYDLTAALGPFMGYAWAADWLYRNTGPKEQGELFGMKLPKIHDNDKVAVGVDGKVRDAVNALVGGSAKGGTGLWIVDTLVDDLINSKEAGGPSDMTIYEVGAKFAGNFFNTALVPAGMIKDIMGTLGDVNYRVVQSTSGAESGEPIDLMTYMLNVATRSLPSKYDSSSDTPVYRPSRDKPLYNVNPFMKMITGWNVKERRTMIEDELARLRIDYRQYSPRKIKGDQALTNIAKGEMGKQAEEYISKFLVNPDYLSLSDPQKKERLLTELNKSKTFARKIALTPLDKDSAATVNRKFKAIWLNTIPASRRNIVDRAYRESASLGNGTSLYEMYDGKGDYEQALKLYMEMYNLDLDKDFVKISGKLKNYLGM